MLDDTVVCKPYARLLGEAAWVWSSTERKTVFGVSVVLLVWSDGQVRIPLGYRVWHKGGPSKYELALDLLSYARNRLKCKPQFVLFDSWYPSKKLLKRIKDYGWYFVCQLKRNRSFEGRALRHYLMQPYWHAVGTLAGGLKVLGVKHRRKYYATNRLPLSAKEVRQLYRKRQEVEEVIRLLKSELNLEGCQTGYRRPGASSSTSPPPVQEHHIALCLVAYLVVERERVDQHLTWRKYKRRLIVATERVEVPALTRLKAAA